MDFLDPKKKRAHTIRLYTGYILVGIAIILGTTLLALEAYGFDFSRKTGQVIQNGLVFVNAQPDVADIYLNNIYQGKTDNRLVIPEGDYTVKLQRTGYRTWSNTFHLGGGLIKSLIYPFLFPTKLISNELKQFPKAPGLVTQSPDRHWLISQQSTNFLGFDQYDLNSATNPAISFTLPANLLTASTGSQALTMVEWSTDNRHVLLKHNYVGGVEYIIVDINTPSSSQNLTKIYGDKQNLTFSLRDKKYDQYYLYDQSTQNLYSSSLSSKQLTLEIEKVLTFKPHGSDLIAYVTDKTSDTKAQLRIKSGKDTYTLRELALSPNYLVNIASFNNHWYIGGGATSDGKIYVYKDPINKIKSNKTAELDPQALLRVQNPQALLFSANARFISVQGGSQFTLYDAEQDQVIRYDTKLPVDQSVSATWMDGHRLLLPSDGKLVVFDFDGTNKQTLVNMSPTQLPYFDRDYTALFTVSPSLSDATKLGIMRTDLKITSPTSATSALKSITGF